MAKTKETEGRATTEVAQTHREQLQGSQTPAQGQDLQQNRNSNAVQERRQGGLSSYGRDPFEMMQQLSAEMDALFDSFLYGRPVARSARHPRLQSMWAPEVEIREDDNQLRICFDLPGVSKDGVKIDMHEGMLAIQGERREERTEGGEQQGFRRSERRYGSFYRSIPLPEGAQAENAQARMADGVLEITVPIARKQARRLEIQG